MRHRFMTATAAVCAVIAAFTAASAPRWGDALRRVAAEDRLATDLDAEVATKIGHGTIDARNALRRGLSFSWSGREPIDAGLFVAVLRDGRVVETGVSTYFPLKSGTNRLPVDVRLPDLSIDKFIDGDRYLPGGVMPESDLNEILRKSAESGVLFGKASVDWSRAFALVLTAVSQHAFPALKASDKDQGPTPFAGTLYLRPIVFVVHRR